MIKLSSMGLVLYGGYYEKDKAIHILNNLKYYKGFDEKDIEVRGILGYIAMCEEKMHEDFLIEKMKVIKSVLDKQGDEALDALQTLTSPDETHFLQPIKSFFKEDDMLCDMFDELSIPMKKEEFYHYLDIYNQVYGV